MMFALIAAAAAVAAPIPLAPPTPAEQTARGERCAALAKSQPEKAIEEARSWASAGGGLAARQCLGIAQASLEQWPAAATTFESAAKDAQIAQNPLAVVLWMQAGNAALAGGESARAGLAFNRTLALPGLSNEMKGEVHLDRARAAVDNGDLPSAKDDLEQATKLVPGDPLGWLLRANLARRMKDLPLAFSAIRQAAQLSPDDASIAYEAGNIAAAAGNMADARAAWTKAATSAPGSNAGKAAALALQGGEAKP